MDNTSNNIISEIAPERLFRQLYDTSSTRKKQSLDRINKACKSQYNLKSKDFSIPTIANLIASEGGPSEQGLRNKNGSDYRLLINAWAEYSDGSIKKINQILIKKIMKKFWKAYLALLLERYLLYLYLNMNDLNQNFTH